MLTYNPLDILLGGFYTVYSKKENGVKNLHNWKEKPSTQSDLGVGRNSWVIGSNRTVEQINTGSQIISRCGKINKSYL